MLYSDDHEAMLGDKIAIAPSHNGLVVACLDRIEYSPDFPEAEWAYLGSGVLVLTDFAGLIHYTESGTEHLTLIARGSEP